MNKIYSAAAFVLAAGILSGCNGFLDRYPYDSISSDAVWKSATLAENTVTGVYSNLKSNYTSATAMNWDALSQVIDPASGGYSSYPYLSGVIQSNGSMFSDNWKRFYEGINRANDVINNIGKTEALSEKTRNCRIAECKFIRAWYYYKLNCLWQGVPIYLENLAPSEYTRKRNTMDEVWECVLNDLNDVIACEDIPDIYKAGDNNYGRISKGAAYALRGKVYMWKKMWEEAEQDFIKVGECGYGLFTGDYADLFTEKNEQCNEMIFSVTMEEESGQGNVYSRTYGNFMTAGNGNNTFYMNTDFVETYQWKDGKPFSYDDVIPGYSSMTPEQRSVYFLRNNLTDSEITAMTAYGADMSKYSAMGNENTIKKAFENRDPRLAATVITPYSTYYGGFASEAATYTARFPFRSEESPTLDLRTRATTEMLYCIRKFVTVGKEYTNVTYNPVDVPIIRYADVLLCLAEAVNEQGRTDEAVDYVNMVRDRAGVAALNGDEPATQVEGQADMRNRIQDEKHWELACEEQLYLEELRWGVWKDRKFSNNNGLKQCWGSNVYTYQYGGDYFLKWAIPSAEKEKNTSLEQNDGWY